MPGEEALPANQTVLRRYDQAKRDLTRLGATVEVSPGSGKASFFASYVRTDIDYDQDRRCPARTWTTSPASRSSAPAACRRPSA